MAKRSPTLWHNWPHIACTSPPPMFGICAWPIGGWLYLMIYACRMHAWIVGTQHKQTWLIDASWLVRPTPRQHKYMCTSTAQHQINLWGYWTLLYIITYSWHPQAPDTSKRVHIKIMFQTSTVSFVVFGKVLLYVRPKNVCNYIYKLTMRRPKLTRATNANCSCHKSPPIHTHYDNKFGHVRPLNPKSP